VEFVQCKHKFCIKCAADMYQTSVTACPCGTPLDINDFSVLWGCAEAKEALNVPTYPQQTCRNHGNRVDVPGRCRTEPRTHKYCYPCDECLLQIVQTTQKCPICYAAYSPNDKKVIWEHIQRTQNRT
jgi:hypothetical protein